MNGRPDAEELRRQIRELAEQAATEAPEALAVFVRQLRRRLAYLRRRLDAELNCD